MGAQHTRSSLTASNRAMRVTWLARGFWIEEGDLIIRLHGLVEIKEQRANLQARAPMGSGCGRKGKQDTAGVGRVISKGCCKGRQPIQKPKHICEPSGPKGRKCWSHVPSRLASAVPQHAQHASASGPLHLPSSAWNTLPQISTQLISSLPSGLCSKVTLSGRPSLQGGPFSPAYPPLDSPRLCGLCFPKVL